MLKQNTDIPSGDRKLPGDNKWRCVHEDLTGDLLADHFRGNVTIGSYTLGPEGSAKYVGIDIDKHLDGNRRRRQEPGIRPEPLRATRRDGRTLCWNLQRQGRLSRLAVVRGAAVRDDRALDSRVAEEGSPRSRRDRGVPQTSPQGVTATRCGCRGDIIGGITGRSSGTAAGGSPGRMRSSTCSTGRRRSRRLFPDEARDYVPPVPERQRAEPSNGQAWDDDEGHWVKRFGGDLRTLDILELTADRTTSGGDSVWRTVTCPWSGDHTTGEEAYVVEATDGKFPVFKCHHAHCQEKRLRDLLEFYGKDGGRCLLYGEVRQAEPQRDQRAGLGNRDRRRGDVAAHGRQRGAVGDER